jgi:histidyl-tRNA synthetase
MDALRDKLAAVSSNLCEDCRRRSTTNPLRVLDCKVPADQPVIDSLPSILDHLCPACAAHFARVRQLLDDRGIAYTVKPRLVRGLDYYTRTTFEFVHGALGAQNSVLGGGRYDGLAEQLDSKTPAPGIGFSIGEDRLVMTVEHKRPELQASRLDLYIAPLGEAALRHAAALAHELRRRGASVELGTDARLKRALELADKLGARFALIVGDNEIAAGMYTLKDMAAGEQSSVSRGDLAARLALN